MGVCLMGASMVVAEFSLQQDTGSFRKWMLEHSGALALYACLGFWVAVSMTLYFAI